MFVNGSEQHFLWEHLLKNEIQTRTQDAFALDYASHPIRDHTVTTLGDANPDPPCRMDIWVPHQIASL